MKNKLLNFLTSIPSSGFSSKVDENGLQSPKRSKTTVFGILTMCLLLCGVQDAFAQPANDACAMATAIVVDAGDCANGVTNGDNTGATADPEVGACFSGGSNGVWFSFVAPASGFVDVTTDFTGGTSNDTEIAVFDGCGGTELGCDQDGGTAQNFNSTISELAVTPGVTLFVQVSGWNGTEGTFCLAVNASDGPPAAPANDECVDAIPVPVDAVGCTGTVAGTTTSSTQSLPGCIGTANDDVWFSFVATAANHSIAVTDTGGGNGFFDIVTEVFDGCGGMSLACQDVPNSPIDVTGLTVGTTYFYRVYSWSATLTTTAEFTTCVFEIPAPPANDECANATAAVVNAPGDSSSVTTGTTISATGSAEVGSCDFGGDFDVWYSLTVPASGTLEITQLDAGPGLEVAIFDGCGGVELACGTLPIAEVELPAGADVTLVLWHDNFENPSNFEVLISELELAPAPANDLCADATPLTVGSQNECNFTVGTISLSSTDSGEGDPACANYQGGDVWYTITVPFTGDVTVDLGNAGGFTDSGMSIYSGTCGALTEIECDDDDSADGLFSMISLTGQTPGDVLFVRVWEFGNNLFGDFNICASSNALIVPCDALPATIEIDGDASVCPNSTITYTAMGGAASIYDWSVSGEGNVVQSQDGNTAEILLGATTDGPFTVSVTETTGLDCATTSTLEVTVENISQLSCRGNLNVSLGANCGAADLDASLFINNAAYGADSYSIVSATDVAGTDVIASGEGFTAGQTYDVLVQHDCSGTQCWSSMFAEDKMAPTLSCPPTQQLGCTADNKPLQSDFPEATDNCCDVSELDFSFSDNNVIAAGSLLADGFNGPLNAESFTLNAVLGSANVGLTELILTTDQINGVGLGEASVVIPYAGEICFDYDYTNNDAGSDDFMIFSTLPDGTQENHLNINATGSGSICVAVAPDDILEFAVGTEGNFGEASTAIISNITYTNTAELVDNSTCGSEFLVRTWTVTDCNGNESESCDQIVFINRPALADIEFPDDITLECVNGVGTDPADLDGLVSDLDDENDGFDEDYPVLEGEDLDEKTCFYVASHTDQVIADGCGNTVKVIRTWTVTDWCSADQVTDIQIIKVEDTTAPLILNCGGSIDIPAAAGACEGFYGIPMPEVFEDCGGPITVTASTGGNTEFNVGDEVFIPQGGTTLVYTVTDACGNSSQCDVTLNLVDTFGPVAICDANTTVSLSTFNNGLSVVCFPTFDDGSFDNCVDDIVIKVKRMDSDDNFSNCVEFGCADGDQTIAVRMRVYDIYLDDFTVAQAESTEYPDIDQERRFSECMIQVLVQDKLDPTQIDVEARTIECVDSFNDISDLGGTSFPTLTTDSIGFAFDTIGLTIDTISIVSIPVFHTNHPDFPDTTIFVGFRTESIFTSIDVCPEDYALTISDNPQLGCGGVGRVFRSWRLFEVTYNAEGNITRNEEGDIIFGSPVDNDTEQILIENNNNIWEPSEDGSAGTIVLDEDGVQIADNTDDLINWPADEVFDCNSGTSQQDVDALLAIMPNVSDLVEGLEDDCASLFLSVNDQIVTDLPDACFAVIREWKIFDDCRFDPNNPDDGGFWSDTTLVTIIDSTAPTFDECADREFDVTAPNCVEVDQVGCSGFADLSVNATDFCGNDAITYRWFLDANADGIVDQIGEGNDASGVYPEGTHSIRYEAEDGCGNVSSCEFEFKITDNKAPTPVCLVLTSTIMPSTGALEIWATDFESGSSCDNCTAFDNLEWRINKGTNRTTPPTTTNVTYDCTSETISFGAPMDVQVWVIDEAGNADFCLTQIIITPIGADDTDHPCFIGGPSPLDIAGAVETEDHEMIEMVDVDVSSTSANPFTTGDNGLFSFFNVPAGGNYVVTPEKDLNPLNGVSTFDLVLISQHILGVQPLDSPYKIIAADANASGSVTTLDLVKIRSVILNIDSDFAPNTSWRFVDMDFVFPDATNPFSTTFPEVIAYNNLSNNELATDFIGVKIGDVNGSATPNQLIGSETRNMNGTLLFETDDIKLIAGNEYTVDFSANDFTELLGYQYSIEFDNDVLEFVNIETGELNELNDTNFGYRMLEEGIITTSWNSAKATSMKDNAVVFSLTFNAKKDGQLSELLSATSKAVKAEAYTTDLDLLDVAIAFNTENGTITSGESFELLQNVPNPFRTETVIGFSLEVASSATIQIMDISGKVLKHIEGDFVRGYNEVKLNKQELQGAGVLHYRLDTPTNTATKKMILID